MINRVVLIGRLTKDPELRRTAQGDAVTSFTLAVNRNFTSSDGQQQADFINCVVWKKSAENVEKYCSKGSLVGVEGRIQTRSYDNQQGQKVYVVEVICNSVQFLDTRQKNQATLDENAVKNAADSWESGRTNPYDFMQDTQQHFEIDPNDIQF